MRQRARGLTSEKPGASGDAPGFSFRSLGSVAYQKKS